MRDNSGPIRVRKDNSGRSAQRSSNDSKNLLHVACFASTSCLHRANRREEATPYMGPYLATYARLLGKGLPKLSLLGLPGALPAP